MQDDTNADSTEGPGPAPGLLRIESTVDGWIWTTGGSPPRLMLGRQGLRIGRRTLFGRRWGPSIPWAHVDVPRVVERSQLSATEPVPVSVPALSLRWTTDGRQAAYAHAGTHGERIVVGEELDPKQAAWLVRAITHLQAADLRRRREAEFDELASGRAGDEARAALDELRGADKE